MRLSDFQYDLPNRLIARFPTPNRTGSRLLCLDTASGRIQHKQFTHILDFLQPQDLLVVNNSRVMPARLIGKKQTGGQVEVLVERILDDHHVLSHVRTSKTPKPGQFFYFDDAVQFEVLAKQDRLYHLRCCDTRRVIDVLNSMGQIPLPPYMERLPEASDHERYQTVYAKQQGSVAAPTAGLHFDENLLGNIRAKNILIESVTLHVGSGTFAPVRVEDITQHVMHSEYVDVSASLCDAIRETKARGGRVIAVGTTTVRSLETAAMSGHVQPYVGETSIFIYPGYTFRCIDGFITNFHLPGSTLLMLVSAFGGYDAVMNAYQEAIREQYRFFSYGDAMFLAPGIFG